MRKSELAVLGMFFISLIVAAYFYPRMPDQMASHWNARGEVDDYMPRLWALALFPGIILGMLVMFMLIPRIDPLRENIREFRPYFDGLVVLISLFMFYIYSLTIAWNLGGRFDMTRAITPSLGALFIFIGFLVENAKRNWFVGIRNPWTLSDEVVWEKTHRIGGKLFKVAGVLALLGFLVPDLAIYLILVPVLSVAVFTFVYSYVEYEKRRKGQTQV